MSFGIARPRGGWALRLQDRFHFRPVADQQATVGSVAGPEIGRRDCFADSLGSPSCRAYFPELCGICDLRVAADELMTQRGEMWLALPNLRLQRTRLREPVSRKPLGDWRW
jgi:hypothetical protein